jgi:hypothetical protein
MRLFLIYLTICLILLSCKSSKADDNLVQLETNDPPQVENTVPQRIISHEEIVVRILGGNSDKLQDTYGNSYNWDGRKLYNCSIFHSPNPEVIMGLQDYIDSMRIYTNYSNSTITDISFLEHLPQLRILYIYGSKGIKTFEPLKYLVSLEQLEIYDDYHVTFDCSILSNMKNLRNLRLLIDDLANKETIFSLPNLEQIWLSNYFKNTATSYYYPEHRIYVEYKPSPAYQYELSKYHISQYRANIRTEPSRDSEVLALLHLNDEVEILENSWIAEKINDVWGLWYKIKYGDIIGYTFGGNIAEKAFVTDIDKNDINDYFYLRPSSSSGIRPETDIIIYINDQRINTRALGTEEWQWVSFGEKDDYIFVSFHKEARDSGFYKTYKVTSDGKIEHLPDRGDY